MTFAPNPVTTEQLVQYLSDHVGNEVGCKNVKEAASQLKLSYATAKGAFRNHPCTIWAQSNFRWLISHGLALCDEYTHRYNKTHSCQLTLEYADIIFPAIECPTPFTRAMPDEYKHDTSISTFTAYKTYIASKPWVASNYLRDPSRKPDWL